MRIYILVLLLFSNIVIAQEKDAELNNLLLQFYSEVSNQNANKALRLSKRIDSLIPISGQIINESLAIYNNSKGFIYYVNGLDPVPHLKKADSLNNLLTEPREDITIISSSILGNYLFNKNKFQEAIKSYSKIIDFKNISKPYYNYKLAALDKVFLMQRIELNKSSDSIQTKNTARKLIKFKRKLNDTLSISFGNALDFIGNKKAAENIFLQISNLSENNDPLIKYDKFQALNLLNNFYYSRFNNSDQISRSDAKKLIHVSEELLSVIENTDFMKTHQIFAIYGDLVVASIVINDGDRINKYESKILKVLDDSSFPNKEKINLKRFYYTIHQLYMYFDKFNENEKAKYYAYKNVELTKHLYGTSVEYEAALKLYETILRTKIFDYDSAYQINLKRKKIIKELYGESSLDYLDILLQLNSLMTSQLKFKESLEITKRAYEISKKLKCGKDVICNDVKLTYLEALNNNGMYNKVFEKFESYNFTNNYKSLFRISKIRRNAYYGLKNYLGINYEFEWLLNQIGENSSELLSNPDVEYEYYDFMTEYQEHLTSTGRLEKALTFTEKNKNIIQKCPFNFLKNKFTLNHIRILIELNRCKEALEIIETGNILTYSDLDTPITKSFYENQLYFKIGLVHSCLGNDFKSIEAFKRHLGYSEKENDLSFNVAYLELSRLYFENKDFSNSKKYRYLFEESLKNKNKLNIATLIVLVDYYNDLGEINKLNEYLTILSSKIIDDICAKSFYSFGDNQSEKLNKNWILNSILSQNNSKYFSDKLTANANMISNLFKRKKDFFGEINLGIQKLEMNNHPDALYLKELKNQYNNNPTKILKEEISQQETKIIGNRIVEYDDLCNFNYNDIINSIDETEIIADLISYKQEKYNTETYAITFHRHQKSNVITQAFLEEDKKLQSNKTLNSSFFEILFRLFEKNKIDFNEKINTFYIIPSGKSNLINFSALSLAFEEKLGRAINIHVINSLSDIPKIKKEKRKSIENLILVGDIDYDKTTNANSINKESQIRGIKLNKSIENSGIPTWSYLPGTKKEIENIGKITMSNGVKTKILSNRTATEINFKKALSHKHNSIVHIATHGFFFPDNPSNELEIFFANHQNPLIRSGLILSGANDNWNNKKLVDQDRDGILTGEEISYMDLSNVELVVLSACDTGLGDVTNLEGINGLQRAFKLAGANKLIMSLWKVPDKETSEFFKHFYKFLLEDKLSINKAFRETQKVMHKKYDPYYWASFVLLE